MFIGFVGNSYISATVRVHMGSRTSACMFPKAVYMNSSQLAMAIVTIDSYPHSNIDINKQEQYGNRFFHLAV
jgi:hypothetical protein